MLFEVSDDKTRRTCFLPLQPLISQLLNPDVRRNPPLSNRDPFLPENQTGNLASQTNTIAATVFGGDVRDI